MKLSRVSRREMIKAAIFFALVSLLIFGSKRRELGTLSEVPLVDPAGVLQVKTWQEFNAGELARGHFPLWNPHTALGQPHLANIQTAVIYPTSIIYAIFTSPLLYDLLLGTRLFLAALFIYWFLRKWCLNWQGASASALIYCFGGYGTWFIQLIDVNSQVMLPLLMHMFGKAAFSRRARDIVLTGIVGLAVITGGHPEAAFNTFLVAGLFLVFLAASNRDARLLQGLLAASAGALFSALLCTVSLLPFANYFTRCFSIHGSGFGLFHLDIRGILSFIFPGIHHFLSGLPARIPVQMLDGGLSGMLAAGYSDTGVPGVPPAAGAVAVFLALVGIVGTRRPRAAACFFTCVLAVFLGLTFGLPGFRLLALIPPLHVASNFKFYLSEIHFCIAVLAGFGLEGLLRKEGRAVLFLVSGVIIALMLAWIQFRLAPGTCGEAPCFSLSLNMLRYESVWLILAVIILAAGMRRPSLKLISSSAFMLLLVASLFYHSRPVGPYVEIGTRNLARAPYLEHLLTRSRRDPPFRITGLEGFFPANLASRFGLSDIRSSDALFYKPYVEMLNALNHQTERQSVDYFYPSYYTRPSPDHLDDDLAALMGIRYVVGEMPLDPELVIEDALVKADLIISETPAQKLVGDQGGRKIPVLFMHAPARLDYAVPAGDKSLLEFSAWLDDKTKDCYSADGVLFQAGALMKGGVRLLYSRFFGKGSVPPDAGVASFRVSEGGGYDGMALSLVTLPGPDDNRVCDWSGWTGLALRGPGSGARHLQVMETEDQHAEPVFISENTLAFPRAFSPSRAVTVSDKETRLRVLSGLPALKLARETVLEELSGEQGFFQDEGSVTLAGYTPDQVMLRVRRASPGYLVLADAHYPGWRAFLDGDEVRILRAYHALRAVVIPRGTHEVVFSFEPLDFRMGLWISLSSLAFGCIFLAVLAAAKRKKGGE